MSNEFSLTESLSEQCKTVEVKELSSDAQSRALGVQWNVSRDAFYYEIKASSNVSEKVTKRAMLSKVSSMYDPLGLISPVILNGRRFFQEAVRKGLDWDNPIPAGLVDIAVINHSC